MSLLLNLLWLKLLIWATPVNSYVYLRTSIDHLYQKIGVELQLGTPYQTVIFNIDIGFDYCFLIFPDPLFKHGKSSSFHHTTTYVTVENSIHGLESTDMWSHVNFYLQNFKFWDIDPVPESIRASVIGFGNGNLSLIEQLYNDNRISNRVFSFEKDTNIYIDRKWLDFSNHFKVNYQWNTKKYIININEFTINNTPFFRFSDNPITLHFETWTQNILIPAMYRKQFYDEIFKDLESYCTLRKGWKMYYVECDQSVLPHFKAFKIRFVFDDFIIVLNYIDLFDSLPSVERVHFRIEFYEDINFIVIGYWFISKYQMVFDWDEKYVAFEKVDSSIYGIGESKGFNWVNEHIMIRWMIVLVIAANWGGGCFLLIIKRKLMF